MPLTDPELLEQFKHCPDDGDVNVAGVTGRVVAKIDTPAGAIVIGGKGRNTYQLDTMRDVAAVIDLGGDNTYYEGTVVARPARAGGHQPRRQQRLSRRPSRACKAAPILGVSMLVNAGGQQPLRGPGRGPRLGARPASASSIDYGGNNRYRGVRRVQGQALGGVGILISRGGHNDYHAAMWAQGFGGPLGFGLLDNIGGNNHYYCGGMYPNSYKPETPGYEGWGQGVGGGIRQVGRRRHRRDPRRRRPQRLRVRLSLPRRRLLVRPGLRPRFRRQQPSA